MNYGWKGSINQFMKTESKEIMEALCLFVYDQTIQEASLNKEENILPQIKAWKHCIDDLKEQLTSIEGELILEYELPRSGGRRPDVLLFYKGQLLVLEFKGYAGITESEKAQASLYVRDLEEYHSAVQSKKLTVRGAVVYPSANIIADTEYNVYLVPNNKIFSFLKKVPVKDNFISTDDFVKGTYQALPSIIESAHHIFNNEPLADLRNIKSSNFEAVLKSATQIADNAKRSNSHHLILITGVPGAGKTYLGLRLAYELNRAVYLSGNGPLVDVLQETLQNKSFVQGLYNYKRSFQKGEVLTDHVLIFDEAQRAWDAERMKGTYSEPDLIMQIAQKRDWSVVVGLIGTGQEIHTGEERGLALWNEAISPYKITVHATNIESQFSNAATYVDNEHLYLNTSLRTHNALQYFEWVEAYLEGNYLKAGKVAQKLRSDRFILKEMDSLEEAKEYVRSLYKGTNKTYGIVTSSKAGYNLPFKTFGYRDKNYVSFYNHPETDYYSNHLNYAVTEFQAQGLELDFAIVYWGEDLIETGSGWDFNYLNRNARDPYQMKLNVYRVLLTRGRDGVIVVKDRKKNSVNR